MHGNTNLNGQVIAIQGLETKRSFVKNAFKKYSQPVEDYTDNWGLPYDRKQAYKVNSIDPKAKK